MFIIIDVQLLFWKCVSFTCSEQRYYVFPWSFREGLVQLVSQVVSVFIKIGFVLTYWLLATLFRLENIHDWCISRQLWWGHRIPVYYVKQNDNSNNKDYEKDFVVARNIDEAIIIATEKYGKDITLYQDEDVLDTWFRWDILHMQRWPFRTFFNLNTYPHCYSMMKISSW